MESNLDHIIAVDDDKCLIHYTTTNLGISSNYLMNMANIGTITL